MRLIHRLMFYRVRRWVNLHKVRLLLGKLLLTHKEKKLCNQYVKIVKKRMPVLHAEGGTRLNRNLIGWYSRDIARGLPECEIHHRINEVEGGYIVDYCIEFKKSLNTYTRRVILAESISL